MANSIGVEIDSEFLELAKKRMQKEASKLYGGANIKVENQLK